MQAFRLVFFQAALSSFSRFGRLAPGFALPGIQRCLLLVCSPAHGRRDLLAPVAGARAGARAGLALDLGGRPLEAGTDLVGLDLDGGALLALLVLPGAEVQPAGDEHARPTRQGLGRVLCQTAPAVDGEVRGFPILPLPGRVLDPS